jgi:hypothetical protein
MEVLPKGIGIARKNIYFSNLYTLNQEEIKVLLKGESLALKIQGFLPRGRGLAMKNSKFLQVVEV